MSKNKGPSIKQIAQELECSQTTVSLILSGRGDEYGLSPDTQERVTAKAAEMGYNPAHNRKRRKTILIANPEHLSSVSRAGFVSDILDPMTMELTKSGWQVLLARFSKSDPFGVTPPLLLRATVVVIPTCRDTASYANTLAKCVIEKGAIPLILGRYYPELDAVFVDSDNAGATRQMAQHLFSLGHRKVAIMIGTPGDRHAEERLDSFREFFADAGFPLSEEMIWRDGDYSTIRGHKVMLEKIDKGLRPTAVFCINDAMALGCLYALREKGISVPEDMSITGFDDEADMDKTLPPLTTLRIETGDTGQKVAEYILDMDREQSRRKIEIRCPARLIVRESSSAPPSL